MKKILVGIDTSKNSEKAFDKALKLAKKFKSKLVLVSVGVGFAQSSEAKLLEQVHRKLINKARKNKVQVEHAMLFGVPKERLLRYAKANKCDLIVIGHFTKLKNRVLTGNISRYIIEKSDIDVLVVK